MSDTNIELIYSTPSMYVDAIAAENIIWPTKYDDGSQNFFIFKNKKIIKSDQLSELKIDLI